MNMISIIILYILSIPLSFLAMIALTANYRSHVTYDGRCTDKVCLITDFLYNKKHRHSLKVWGISAFLPMVNIGIIIMVILISIFDIRVGLPTIIGELFKRMFKTQRLLDRVSKEV